MLCTWILVASLLQSELTAGVLTTLLLLLACQLLFLSFIAT